LWVLAGAAVLAALVAAWIFRPRAEREEVSLEVAAPVAPAVEVAEAPPLPFVDVTRAWGIDTVHVSGARGEKLLPETMGGGVALFDADGDGDADLLLTSGSSWPHDRSSADAAPSGSTTFYRNEGGRFVDATRAVGLSTPGFYGTGVAIGDVDGDERPDVYLTSVGGNRLYRNTGDGFENVTDESGVAGEDDLWATSAAFFDGDGDGDLDLFVGNYVVWSRQIDLEIDHRLDGVGRAYGPPVQYRGTFPSYYRNDGGGRFIDTSAESGLHVVNAATGVPVGKALGVVPVDLDLDGDLDVLVANDTVRNFLFLNRGDGRFEEVAEPSGLAYGRAGEATGAMGIDAGYYRNDDDLGVAIGNFANEMTSLYVAQGEPTLFADEAIGDGVGAASRAVLTFGMLFLDVDLDGRLDLLETNGHLEDEISTVDASQSYEQAAQLFWNAGLDARATFVEVPSERLGDLATPIVGRGSAAADLDGDGDLDLVMTQAGRPPLVLRNDQATGHRWLRVRLRQPNTANPRGVGALVTVEAGGTTQRRQMMPARSYQSSSEAVITFGLGEATTIQALHVRWSDGVEQSVPVGDLGLDRELTIERDPALAASSSNAEPAG
ncbi:MAG: CRTAC1 family protein, partial [Acidobacteriota bacterium]